MIYLASPYSHPDPAVRLARFEAANRAAGELMRQGLIVFSPISHSHPIATICDLPLEFDFYMASARYFIQRARMMIVLTLQGWMESRGVMAEIDMARDYGLPVEYRNP